MKKYIALVCALAMLISLMPLSALPVWAEAADPAAAPYQVGYARVDINPYVVEDDPSSGIMALPLRGYGDFWDRLSTELTDDSGDGIVDENDGLFATCIAISDENGNAILLYTIDMLGGDFGKKARPVIAQRINAALESGELTGLQQITEDRIQVSGTHTHSSIASSVYSSNGRTGTNSAGIDLGVVNENLGIWIERTLVDLGDAAIEALKDRADAKISKDQLSVRDATTPILQNKRLNSIRHYNTDVDGDEFVGGNGFNAVDKWDYQNPEDYRTPRGVDPKAVSQVDDNMYFLRFDFPETDKLPVLMVSWRGHPSNNGGATDGRISSDYVNSFCHALEYGCEVTFDTTNGFLTGWTLGTTRKYRAAFFQGTGGNVNVRSDELITYPGSAGDVVQYANEWLSAKVYPTGNEAESCTYGVVLAQLALECVTDGLNETKVENGDLRTMQMTYYAPWKTSSISALGYEAALAYKEANAIKTVGVPYKYTSPETGEIFLISSKYHANNLVNSWNLHLNAPKVGTDQLTLHAITLGDDVAFLTMPGEVFDYYTKDTSLTGDALFAPENNLWNDLVDDTTYGKPFVLGYCNAYEGYLPNETAFDYNKGSIKWANGSYETHTTPYERGTGEEMLRIYDQMLTALAYTDGDMSYTGPCEHCGEDQLWQPYSTQTTLTTGHYYLCSNIYTSTIKISGGQTVCLDLNGHTLQGETRAITTLDSTKDILNIMDSSAEQTGILQGCGALYGAARALYSGTISLAAGDELNLYSGTLTAYQRTAYSVNRGGVLHIGGTFNMYGGKVTGGTASSFTGSYYSGGAVSATKNGYGGCIYNAGTCNFFGGTVTGGSVTTITGTVTEPDTGYVYSQEESPLENRGDCVWSTAAAVVNLNGDAQVDHLRFADDDGLNVVGIYTGSAEVEFNSLTELESMTVVGGSLADTQGNAADASLASITFTDAPDKTAAVKGSDLVISDLPYTYGTCEVCGDCQWLPVTHADMKAVGENGLTPRHYRLTEDMTVAMRRLNKNGDCAGTYCIDLAGHTYTGASRPFTVYSGAELNIFDTVGGGAVEGKCAADSNGSAIYLYSGGVAALYGGTLRHNADNTVATGGVVCAAGGHFSIHGGTVEGTAVTGRGGAISVSSSGSFTATGGTVTMGTADTAGSCVYAAKGCAVTLCGTADIAQITFSGIYAENLSIDGGYTGSVKLSYPASVSLEAGTVIGSIFPAGDLSNGNISVDATCKTVAASGDSLVIADQHSYRSVITAPTCTEVGYTTYICDCGDSYVSDEVAAAGHRYETVTVNATCTEEGSVTDTCSVCGDTQIQTIPATGHSYETVMTAPTCTEAGYTTYTCACGDSYVADEVAAVGHSYSGGVCTTCDACEHCGDCRWIAITEADLEKLQPGHYRLSESIGASQQQLTTAGTYCIDLAGHTFTGSSRAFYLGTGATLNIMDSMGGGAVEGKSGASLTGGVIYIYSSATVNLYGGTLRHNTQNSETVTTGGVVCVSGGTFHMYNGTVEGTNVTGYGGAIMVSSRDGLYGTVTVSGGEITKGAAGGSGDCVYVNAGCKIVLTGNAMVDEIRFAGDPADALEIAGIYTGMTVLRYPASAIPTDGTDVGNAENADISSAMITVANVPCMKVGVSGTDLVVNATHSYEAVVTAPTCTEKGFTTYTCHCGDTYTADEVAALGHKYETVVTAPTCTEKGFTTYTCHCGDTYTADEVAALGHKYETVTVDATCTMDGSITDTCSVCNDTKVEVIPAVGHSFANGTCGTCGEVDPDYVAPIVKPTLTLKVPTLEFKDMICIIAFYTAENIEDVVEMGMITYSEKVSEYSVETADHVIPGYNYDAGTGRYYSSSQGIHAKYLGDTVYMACYAKLKDGSYVYTKLKSYSPVQYATNQLANSTDNSLKQLVAAMLNYGAAAQLYFGHNTDALANASLTEDQKALPEAYRDDMINAVPSTSAEKQGIFANNKGFSSRKPAVSFEGAFSINYFMTPKYAPVDGITLYYWNEADYNAADVLTAENATGSVKMTGSGTEQYRGDVAGISAKDLSKAVYVAAVYSDGTTTWTSGVLGYSIGVYCGSLATQGGTVADLAMTTAVYGYHAKQYFG